MLALAVPIILAELGWMSMSVVDIMVVGRLPDSAQAIGAVGIGSVLFYTIGLFGTGLLLGLDTLVAQAFGAGDLQDCHHSLLHGIYVAVAATPVLMGCVWLAMSQLGRFGIEEGVHRAADSYLNAIVWSTFPLLLYFAFRRYLQGMDLVRPVMTALITANLVNLAANWVLVFGHLGVPAQGVAGSGWATCASRGYMAIYLGMAIVHHDRRRRSGLFRIAARLDPARFAALLRLGLPAAGQIGLEIAIFALAAFFIGKLDPTQLAAHQIAVMGISVAFMFPLGLGSAAAVRVGQAIGRDDLAGAAVAGWTALLLSSIFETTAALLFVLAPVSIGRIFTRDPAILHMAITLLALAALFALFDGFQAVSTGALRGAGDTRTPMLCHFVAYWLVGLPVGWFLCFRRNWGAAGFWAGFDAALIPLGLVLVAVWRRRSAERPLAAFRAVPPLPE